MKRIISIILTLALVSGIILTSAGCEKKVDPVTDQGYYLDTICDITIYDMKGMTEKKAKKVIQESFDMCNDLENLLSKTRESSDIYKINHAGGEPVKCNPTTIEVIKKGIHYGEISDGLFDITIGKATDLWDFHAENPKVPEKADLDNAIQHVDYTKIKIDGDTVQLEDPEMEIDLGGIAKGFISDKVAALLEEKGVTGAIVNLGGNISAVGYKNGKNEDFNIGIKKPYTKNGEIIGSVKLSNGTIVTSGAYERYFEQDGKKYYHILDPKTGYPMRSGLESVTIIGEKGTSVDCDALATICFMKGVKDGTAFINKMDGYEAIFYDSKGNIVTSDDMYNFEKSNE